MKGEQKSVKLVWVLLERQGAPILCLSENGDQVAAVNSSSP